MRDPITRRRRYRAEAMMKQKCHITRVVKTTDPETYKTEKQTVTVYGGPSHPEQRCKVQSFRGYEEVRGSAGRTVVTQRREIHVPVGAGPFQIGDVIVVEGNPHSFVVGGLADKSFQTAQRLLVDQESNKES